MNIESSALVGAKHRKREKALIRRHHRHAMIVRAFRKKKKQLSACGCRLAREMKFYLHLLSGRGNSVCVCVCKQFGFSSSHLLIQICQHSSYSLSLSPFFLCCRNPYGQSVGNHRAGVDHVPRERGELVCVCACV